MMPLRRVWRFLVIIIALVFSSSIGRPRDYPITPVKLTEVRITDGFWHARLEINRKRTIPAVITQMAETGDVKNFEIAGGLAQGEQCGVYPFNDTNVYKTIEGISYSLMLDPDPELAKYIDSLIVKIKAAQEPDGYLYTARTNQAKRLGNWAGKERWSQLERSHELYNAGHLYEAAVAHYQATGKRTLLEVALKNADLIDSVFGPNKKRIPPGHQEIEIGLIKLYRVTGNEKYLQLAKFFLDERGYSHDGRKLFGEYAQDHKPILVQDEAVGHAVRAPYMYAAMAEAALTGDHKYLTALDRLWENVVGKKLYLTGGLGAQGFGEGFAANYELPNMSAYNETCASVANALWNYRMFLLHGDGKYIDVFERTVYNALLSGVSLGGDLFFYPNPLASRGQNWRTPWFDCACCPPNVIRFLAAFPGFVYARRENAVYVNLFVASQAHLKVNDMNVALQQETNYPWEGSVKFTVAPESPRQFTIYIRIPGWARHEPVPSDLYRHAESHDEQMTLKINGNPVALALANGFARIQKTWRQGDVIELSLSMPVHRVQANEKVEVDRGRAALERGPLVYCAEWQDNKDGHVLNLVLPDNAEFQTEFRPDLLNGVVIIKGKAMGVELGEDGKTLVSKEQDFVAIPYHAWANRGAGEMSVWFAREPSKATPLGHPPLALLSRASSSGGTGIAALNDQKQPQSSHDTSNGYFSWSPGKDTVWVQYDFKQMEEVSEVQVYWFDDSNSGHCRVPKSWRILAWVDGKWQAVYSPAKKWGVEKGVFNRVVFETARTNAIRLEAIVQPGYASGILEWRVY